MDKFEFEIQCTITRGPSEIDLLWGLSHAKDCDLPFTVRFGDSPDEVELRFFIRALSNFFGLGFYGMDVSVTNDDSCDKIMDQYPEITEQSWYMNAPYCILSKIANYDVRTRKGDISLVVGPSAHP